MDPNILQIYIQPLGDGCERNLLSVAESGFPRGGTNPKGGRQPIIWQIFPENCMKMKTRPPLRSATGYCTSTILSTSYAINSVCTVADLGGAHLARAPLRTKISLIS